MDRGIAGELVLHEVQELDELGEVIVRPGRFIFRVQVGVRNGVEVGHARSGSSAVGVEHDDLDALGA